jgi:DNA-binding PucR family transcriptional regulator
MPRTHALMKQHGVAAIVPFYPHSQTASSWMLLGEAFSEEVYTPRDFRMVEQLFAKLSDLFLDKLIIMRTQLANAQRQARALDQRLLKTEENLAVLQKENRDLREQNTRLMTESTARVRASVLGHAGVDDGVHRGAAEPGSQSVAMNKTLDEYVTGFEAQIIRQTLERCDGNKSKAARRLGLRPNTLHYKLERYGISAGKKNSAGEK